MKLILESTKKIFILFFFVLPIQAIYSQNPNFEWAKKIGGNGSDNSKATAIDSRGNIYITGSFFGIVDFDPGVGTYNMTASKFGVSAFMLKLDSSGNFIWAKKFGSNGFSNSTGLSVTIDKKGNVYSTGFFSDTVDFDPGLDSFKLIAPFGFLDIFISKLDSSGNFVWAKRLGSNADDVGYSIGLDSSANIYLTGYFQGTVDFNPNLGTFNMVSKGSWDMFVCKLDSSGGFSWAKQIGGTGSDVGNALFVDKQGNSYLTGSFQDSCDFDPGNGLFKFGSFGKEDIFILHLNSFGDFEWAKQIGGSGFDIGKSITLDNFGKVSVAGGFSNIAYLYPGPAGNFITSAGKMDIFISKFDTLGNFSKLLQIGGDSDDIANSLAVDKFGSTYCTGRFQDTVDFNPGIATNNLISTRQNDIFIFKMDSAINYNWSKHIGGIKDEEGTSILIDPIGNVITSGDFYGIVDFDPGLGIFNQTAIGTDFFIQKMKQCSNSFSTMAITGCDSAIVNNQTYKSTGSYTQTRPNFTGCDSIITINVTLKRSSSNIIVDTACDSLVFNGIKYTTTGVYTQVTTNAIGCDSNITLNLIIKKSTARDLYISSCKSYKLNNQLYSKSGTYYQSLKNAFGCDSSITLILDIRTVDTSVTRNGSTLKANSGVGTIYQWIDCGTFTPIQGETNQDFTAFGTGSYAVIVSKNLCTDTSSCIYINGVGMSNDSKILIPKVFPNPTSDIVNIQLPYGIENCLLRLTNEYGQILFEKRNMLTDNESIDLSKFPNGSFILEIKNNDAIFQIEIIKLN